MTCRHCQRAPVSRPRGLCWGCYYTPTIRDLYPSVSKFGRRGVVRGPLAFRLRRFRVHHRHRHRLLTLAHVPAGIAGDDVGGDIT